MGDVMVQDGNVFGDGVNVAARLEPLAQPGGISVSHTVREHVEDRVEYGFDDLGEQHVKNIARPLRVFRLVFDPDAAPAQPPSPRVASSTTSDAASEVVEITIWQSVEASGTAAEYRAYLERYPNGSFAALAQARLGSTSTTHPRSPNPSIELAFWNSIKRTAMTRQCSWPTWRNTRMASFDVWPRSTGPLTHLLALRLSPGS